MKETEDSRPVHELEPPPFAPQPSPDDMTVLERWARRAIGQGPLFWVLLGGAAVALAGVSVVVSSLSAAKSATGQAWIDAIPANTAEERLRIAEANSKTPVSAWMRLQAAEEEYRAGLDDLTQPGRRESAGPRLKRALDLFSQVAAEAPHDTPQARGAALAVARVHEARNELPEAIKQYRLVADEWKDSPEAKEAATLARRLEDPNSVQFYKDLYAAKPAADVPAIPPPSLPVPPGGKPADIVVPGTSAAGKSFLQGLSGPLGIDAPPPSPTPAPAPAPPEAKPEAKPAEPPKAEAIPTPTVPAPK